MYTMGDLLDLKQEALTQKVVTIRNRGKRLVGMDEIFYASPRKNIGTDVAKWTIFKDNIALGKWAVRGTPARKVDPTGARKLSQALQHIYISTDIEEEVLLYCESPSENEQQRAAEWIEWALTDLMSKGDHLMEWAIWQLLTTGQIAIDQSDDESQQIIKTLTFGVDAAHVAQNSTLNYSAAATKILSDTTSGEAWGDLIVIPDDDGYQVTDAYMNDKTNRYLFGNTEIQKLWSDPRRDILWQNNMITRLDTVDVHTYRRKYQNDAGSLVKFLADDIIVGVPSQEDRQRLFVIQEGECMVPNDTTGKLEKRMGKQAWVVHETNPERVALYYKWNAVPVLMDPDAFFSRNVVPAP